MYARHNDVPPMEVRHGRTVDARYYNHVQTALKKLGPEIRIRLTGLKHLDLIIQKDAWIVVDRVLNDVPVVAWTNFQVQHRESLHEPIVCEIRIWHALAGMILTRTLQAMDLLLGQELEELEQDDKGHRILRFPPKQSD
jgi:hypothetical protein